MAAIDLVLVGYTLINLYRLAGSFDAASCVLCDSTSLGTWVVWAGPTIELGVGMCLFVGSLLGAYLAGRTALHIYTNPRLIIALMVPTVWYVLFQSGIGLFLFGFLPIGL